MKKTIVALLLLAGAACGVGYWLKAPVSRGEPEAVSPTVVQFLLNSAAADFHAHRPPDPARFRDVRVGYVMAADGEKRYRLCGQFLPAQGAGKAEWTSFVTIKTSDYEQYIGGPAGGYRQDPSAIWDDRGDLSPELQSRLDALR